MPHCTHRAASGTTQPAVRTSCPPITLRLSSFPIDLPVSGQARSQEPGRKQDEYATQTCRPQGRQTADVGQSHFAQRRYNALLQISLRVPNEPEAKV